MSSLVPSDVLRYWMALLRQEEALAVRPKARRGASTASASAVTSPRPGQDYAKLPFAANQQFLLQARGTLESPLTPEVSEFFEDWLHKQYRGGREDGRLEHLVSFPTLHLPRDELGGVLRFGVDVQWWGAGQRFSPPKPAQRRSAEALAPPDLLKVMRVGFPTDDALPYFVDTKILRDVLRVDGERIDEFFARARERSYSATEQVLAVCELLASQLRDDGHEPHLSGLSDTADAAASLAESQVSQPELLGLLRRLTAQRLQRLSSRCRVYGVALLLDASRNRTTFHVQRDLQAALSFFESNQLEASEPLMSYLSASAANREGARNSPREPIVGRFPGAGLTTNQREAAERFLGGELTAVQGPPGTGKTHVILTLAVSELIRKVSPLQRIKQPGPDLMLVTSTNNRAVDNVIRPLGPESGHRELALALRVGSRDVIEKVTQAELLRAKSWMERQSEVSDEEFAKAVAEFVAAERRTESRLAPHRAELESSRRLASTEQALAELPDELPAPALSQAIEASLAALGAELAGSAPEVLDDLLQCLRELSLRLRVLSELSEAAQGTAPKHLSLHYKVTRDRQLSQLEKILGAPLQLDLPPVLPPRTPAPAAREAWEEAAEHALSLVTALRDALEAQVLQETRVLERRRLTKELSALRRAEGEETAEIDWAASELEQAELYEAAVRLREAWARANKRALLAALTQAAQTCARSKSLRVLLESTKGPGVWLRRLFPVWGCTLLSIGNNFSPDRRTIRRVVIDEAGQCHGAYAVSALLRSGSALVIGDVNQLEPVVELSQADESRVLRGTSPKSSHPQLSQFRVYQGSRTSAQSIADQAVTYRPILTDHFRSQEEIAAISDELCEYGLLTHTPRRSHAAMVPELSHPVLFSAVDGQQQRFSGSWVNSAELLVVTQWLHRLLRAGLSPSDIGVITPFRGQLERLWLELRAARIPLERPLAVEELEQGNLFAGADTGVALGTVHRFQGGERSVILFSTTVTEARSLPFVDERVNLVNVAASRAREHLVTIGHAPTLKVGQHTRVLVERACAANALLSDASSSRGC